MANRMIIKLEKEIMQLHERIERLLKQGFIIVGIEDNTSIILVRSDDHY